LKNGWKEVVEVVGIRNMVLRESVDRSCSYEACTGIIQLLANALVKNRKAVYSRARATT
jgi:hypothetical protein